MFLHVSVSHSVHRGGVLSQHALQVVSQHALHQGGSAPGGWGCLLGGGLLRGVGAPAVGGPCSRGSACSRGVRAPGGACSWEGVCGNPPPPESRQLLCGRCASYWNAFLLKRILIIGDEDTFGSKRSYLHLIFMQIQQLR